MGLMEIEGTLRRMLSGDINLIEGCRLIVRYRGEIDQIATSEYAVIAGVESETDDLPVGEQRSRWSTDELERADLERKTYLRSVEEPLLAACRGILAKIAP